MARMGGDVACLLTVSVTGGQRTSLVTCQEEGKSGRWSLNAMVRGNGQRDAAACQKNGWRAKKKWLGEYHLTKNNLIFVTEKS